MRLGGVLTFLLCLAVSLSGEAQSASAGAPNPPDQSTSTDPAELMRLAGAVNRLVFPGAQPWHLKANYEVLDAFGHKTDHGVYEVFWAGPGMVRQIYASKSFTQTDYLTASGILRTGDMRWASGPERVVAAKLLVRMPSDGLLSKTSQQLYPAKIDGQNFRCVTLNSNPPVAASATMVLPTYCLDMENLALRRERGTGHTSSELSGDTVFNDIQVFQGHYIAKDIRVTHYDKPYLHIHVETLEEIAHVDEAEFQPPAAAQPAGPPRPVISNREMLSRLIQRKEPGKGQVFPEFDFDGRAVLCVIVGKDGTVTRIRPISGSEAVQTLLSKAVAQWVYRPYLAGGQPVEVETEVVEMFGPEKH